MTKQHDHNGPAVKPSFDIMEWMRKPHGLATIAVLIGLAGWAVWTFWVW